MSGRSENTEKLHASAGMPRASARTRSFVAWSATRKRKIATHAPARPTAMRIPIAPIDRSSAPYMSSASHDCAIQCVPAAVYENGSRCGIPWSRISSPVRRCHRNELSPSDRAASAKPPKPYRIVMIPAIDTARRRAGGGASGATFAGSSVFTPTSIGLTRFVRRRAGRT